jgi:hypothetical protein
MAELLFLALWKKRRDIMEPAWDLCSGLLRLRAEALQHAGTALCASQWRWRTFCESVEIDRKERWMIMILCRPWEEKGH